MKMARGGINPHFICPKSKRQFAHCFCKWWFVVIYFVDRSTRYPAAARLKEIKVKLHKKKLLKSRNLPNFVYTVFQHSVKLFLKGKY